jgi:hypothetical protein
MLPFVIPANEGIQRAARPVRWPERLRPARRRSWTTGNPERLRGLWIPAFAGMTKTRHLASLKPRQALPTSAPVGPTLRAWIEFDSRRP